MQRFGFSLQRLVQGYAVANRFSLRPAYTVFCLLCIALSLPIVMRLRPESQKCVLSYVPLLCIVPMPIIQKSRSIKAKGIVKIQSHGAGFTKPCALLMLDFLTIAYKKCTRLCTHERVDLVNAAKPLHGHNKVCSLKLCRFINCLLA